MILGAGISGLSLGWFLKEHFGDKIRLSIVDQANRAGGWVRTDFVEGCLFEAGPRSLRPKGAGLETLKLIEKLNLQNQVIAANPDAKYRYLWTGGKLQSLPTGPISMMRSSLTRSAPWVLLKEYFKAKSSLDDESIAQFVSHRFSPHFADKLVDPLTTGIYAGDINKLSIRSCFPKLYEWEQEYGSVVKGMLRQKNEKVSVASPFVKKLSRVPIFSFKNGMETLTNALADQLLPYLRLKTSVTALHLGRDNVEVELEDGHTLHADHVFSALPAYALSQLFKVQHQELSSLLKSITGSSVAVVNVGFFRKVLKKRGFGYLIPSCEEEKVLGCVFDSDVFPEQNQTPEETRLTVMIGGAHQPSLIDLPKEKLKCLALSSLQNHLGIEAEPDAISIHVARSAIPQYFVGHMEKIMRIGTILAEVSPCMTLTGNSFLGVSVNDCIANSKRIAICK